MTAEIIPLNLKLLPRKVAKRVVGKLSRKRRAKACKTRNDRVSWDLINECASFGKPDYRLIGEIFDDLSCEQYTDLDIFAIYLYRKKLKG